MDVHVLCFLQVGADIGEFSEVIRAYHRLIDLREKHVDTDVSNQSKLFGSNRKFRDLMSAQQSYWDIASIVTRGSQTRTEVTVFE